MTGTPRRLWLALASVTAVVLVVSGLFLLRNDTPETPPGQAFDPETSASTGISILPTPSASTKPTPTPTPSKAVTSCTVSPILVNSCRPWLGARANGYASREESFRMQTEYHEERIGRQLDIAHTYTAAGGVPLTNSHDVALAQRPGTYLFANWKPAANWADAAGGNAEVESRIDRAAANVKRLGSKKIFMTLHHEPENDTTVAPGCKTKPGATGGTPAQYRRMWQHVRERFDALGVRNVVWVMDYMNYPPWDCLVPQLYPGDKYVDWIMFNAYGSGSAPNYVANVSRFYQLLTSLNMRNKPWGIVEWGVHDAPAAAARDYYRQAAKALAENRFPRLHAYMIFDSPGTHNQGGLRIGYDDAGRLDPAEEDAYRQFANSSTFKSS